MSYDVIKSLHLIAVISWMVGLLYLPRLFVYHNESKQRSGLDQTFLIMDDLHDNSFFLDHVSKNKKLKWKILNVKKGFIGLIYPESFNSYLK